MEALTEWEKKNEKAVYYVMKGTNSLTEHYSAFRAEVIIKKDPKTSFNMTLFNELMSHDKVFVAGQAKSHCVNFTVRDLVNKMEKERVKQQPVIYLMEGGMSSVPGFEEQGDKFWKELTSWGTAKISEKQAKVRAVVKTHKL